MRRLFSRDNHERTKPTGTRNQSGQDPSVDLDKPFEQRGRLVQRFPVAKLSRR